MKIMFEDKKLQKQYEEDVERLIKEYGFGSNGVLVEVKLVKDDEGKDKLEYNLNFVREGDKDGTMECSDGAVVFYKEKYKSLKEGKMSEYIDLYPVKDFQF